MPRNRLGLLALVLSSSLASGTSAAENEASKDDDSYWSGSVSAGASFLTGNSQSLTLTGDALAEYLGEQWEFYLEAALASSWAASADEEEAETVAEWLELTLRGERLFGPRLSAFVLVAGEVNHPASLEARSEGEVGIGITLLSRDPADEERSFLRLYLGAHAAKDFRFQYFPTPRDLVDVTHAGPGAGLRLRLAINERVALSELVRVYPNVLGEARLLAFSDTELSAFMTERLALNVHLRFEHDSRPAEGRKPTDAALTFGLEWNF